MDTSVRPKGLYGFGPFVLDPVRRLLTREGTPVALTPTVFDTLLHLVENHGRVVTKDELLDAIWPGRVVEESNVTQTVFTLRKALGGAEDSARFIVTAPGRGYRFAEQVRFEAGAPSAVTPWDRGVERPQLREDGPGAGRAAKKRPRLALAAVAICGLVLIGVGAFVALRPWRSAPVSGVPALVVMADLRNLTGEPIFDRTLATAMEIDLDQSPLITVLPQRRVEDTLALMTRPSDAALTPVLAGEVCARNGARAVLQPGIAAFGKTYLLTVTATDCAGSRTLAAEKAQVTGREAVIAALDKLTAAIRERLGESAGSIQRFDIPLARERTVSLAALKAYSEGAWRVDHGRRIEAIPLFQHAIELDPNFAMAYAALSAIYVNSNDFDRAAEYGSKAYALRMTVGERARFHLAARYTESVLNDTEAAIRTYRAWTAVYPEDDIPWANLANAENWIGHFSEAVAPAQRALALNASKEAPHVVLARSLLYTGRVGAAARICAQAVAKGLAGDDTHGLLVEIAAASGDQPAMTREVAWALARGKSGERKVLLYAARDAYRRGRVREGESLFARVSALSRDQGLTDYTLPFRARELTDLGLKDRALVLLDQVPASDQDDSDFIFSQAEIGDAARARSLLQRELQRSPRDTLEVDVFAPETRAALAMRRGQAAEAVAALRPVIPYEMRTFDTLYLRGRAYLAAGDAAAAAVEFRKILDHPTIEATSPLLPLARLGLARALRLEGDLLASRREYQAVLDGWKNADTDLPALQAAKAEYARL